MPDKSYYNRLYAFQDEIMKIIQRQGVDFYLTGGTALSRCYLNHRYSDDLDFFKLFDTIKWIIPADQKVLDKERLQMHDDIFYGRSNSLVD